MATTIPGAVSRIKTALDAHFEGKGFAWKTQESQTEHSQAKPTVFALVCANRTADNWPEVCPSVTLEVQDATVNNDALALNLVCHCVIVNSAIIDREKMVRNAADRYEFLTTDGFTEEGVREALFSDCLLLAEETMNALRGMAGVSNIRLIPPQSFEDFPHCQCQVTATVQALTQFIEHDLL